MAKILISPLGVGPASFEDKKERRYRVAKYKFENSKEEYETPFVSAALVEHLDIDRMYLIGTSKSMWEEVYTYFSKEIDKKIDEDYWIDIAEKTSNANSENKTIMDIDLKPINSVIDDFISKNLDKKIEGSRCLIIDYGLNEKELWNIFEKFMHISDYLNKGDEIYLDITHSFRSLPLYMYLITDYMRLVKNNEINISGIYYGMIDVIKEKGHAPIINLKPLFELSEWIRGTYDFLNYGNGYIFSNLLKNQKLGNTVNKITELINLNYLVDLKKQFKKLNEILKDENDSSKIFSYVKPELRQFLNRFHDKKKDSEFQFEFAKWFFENKRYANSLISLNEAVLTRLCELYGRETRDRTSRGIFKAFLKDKKYYSHLPEIKNLHDIYTKLNKKRAKVAHASLNEDHSINENNKINSEWKKILSKNFKKEDVYFLNDIDDLKNYIQELNSYINKNKFNNFKNTVSFKKLQKKFQKKK